MMLRTTESTTQSRRNENEWMNSVETVITKESI